MCQMLHELTGQFANKPTHGQSNCKLVNSQTSQFVNSKLKQFTTITTITTIVQSFISTSWLAYELTSLQFQRPQIGLSANCLVTLRTWCMVRGWTLVPSVPSVASDRGSRGCQPWPSRQQNQQQNWWYSGGNKTIRHKPTRSQLSQGLVNACGLVNCPKCKISNK